MTGEREPLVRQQSVKRNSRTQDLADRLTGLSNAKQEKHQEKAFTIWAVVVLVLYVGGGVFVYSVLGGMSPLDAAYFCIVTLTTVGYGDISLEASSSPIKMFGIVYILAGIGLVASLLSYLVGMLLAKQEKLILEALQEQQVEVNAAEMQVKLEIQNDKTFIVQGNNAKLKLRMNLQGILREYASLPAGVDAMRMLTLTFLDALYLVIVSATTVGYGDAVPKTDFAKAFTILYLPMITLALAKCISDYTSVQLDKRTEDMHRRVLMAKIDEDTFKGMDHNQGVAFSGTPNLRHILSTRVMCTSADAHTMRIVFEQCLCQANDAAMLLSAIAIPLQDNQLDKYEFLTSMLVAQGKIKTGDIAEAEKRFKQLDKDGSGFLTLEDMKNMQWL
eukprot:6612-Heterococcus_DN1.PRE.1